MITFPTSPPYHSARTTRALDSVRRPFYLVLLCRMPHAALVYLVLLWCQNLHREIGETLPSFAVSRVTSRRVMSCLLLVRVLRGWPDSTQAWTLGGCILRRSAYDSILGEGIIGHILDTCWTHTGHIRMYWAVEKKWLGRRNTCSGVGNNVE